MYTTLISNLQSILWESFPVINSSPTNSVVATSEMVSGIIAILKLLLTFLKTYIYIQCATDLPLTTPAVCPTTKGESGSGGAAYLHTNKLA